MRELAVVVNNSNKTVSAFETIDAIKEAGFKNVFIQWYDVASWEYSQEKQLEYIREKGLNVIFAHLGYQTINTIWEEGESGDALVERYQKDIRECKENGIDLVIMHLTSKNVAPMYNELGLSRLRKITDYAKEMGVRVAFENTKIQGYLEYVLGAINEEHVGMCFDVGHFHAHFNDKFDHEFVKNRIFAVHLHDNDTSSDQHLLPFDGTLDWEMAMGKIKDCNYEGPITVELCYRNDYLNNNVEEFYKEGYKRANKVRKLYESI